MDKEYDAHEYIAAADLRNNTGKHVGAKNLPPTPDE